MTEYVIKAMDIICYAKDGIPLIPCDGCGRICRADSMFRHSGEDKVLCAKCHDERFIVINPDLTGFKFIEISGQDTRWRCPKCHSDFWWRQDGMPTRCGLCGYPGAIGERGEGSDA